VLGSHARTYFGASRSGPELILTIRYSPVGRCAGWIAHAIEQYQSGEPERILSVYKGDPSRQMVEHQAFRGYEDANRN
jgi:hypothetical protein